MIDDEPVVAFIHFKEGGARELAVVSVLLELAAHEKRPATRIGERHDLFFRHERFGQERAGPTYADHARPRLALRFVQIAHDADARVIELTGLDAGRFHSAVRKKNEKNSQRATDASIHLRKTPFPSRRKRRTRPQGNRTDRLIRTILPAPGTFQRDVALLSKSARVPAVAASRLRPQIGPRSDRYARALAI